MVNQRGSWKSSTIKPGTSLFDWQADETPSPRERRLRLFERRRSSTDDVESVPVDVPIKWDTNRKFILYPNGKGGLVKLPAKRNVERPSPRMVELFCKGEPLDFLIGCKITPATEISHEWGYEGSILLYNPRDPPEASVEYVYLTDHLPEKPETRLNVLADPKRNLFFITLKGDSLPSYHIWQDFGRNGDLTVTGNFGIARYVHECNSKRASQQLQAKNMRVVGELHRAHGSFYDSDDDDEEEEEEEKGQGQGQEQESVVSTPQPYNLLKRSEGLFEEDLREEAGPTTLQLNSGEHAEDVLDDLLEKGSLFVPLEEPAPEKGGSPDPESVSDGSAASDDEIDWDEVLESDSFSDDDNGSDDEYEPEIEDYLQEDDEDDDSEYDEYNEYDDDFVLHRRVNKVNLSNDVYYKAPFDLTKYLPADMARLVHEYEDNLRVSGLDYTLKDFGYWHRKEEYYKHFGGQPAPAAPPKGGWPHRKVVETVAYKLAVAAQYNRCPLSPLSGSEPWTSNDNIGYWNEDSDDNDGHRSNGQRYMGMEEPPTVYQASFNEMKRRFDHAAKGLSLPPAKADLARAANRLVFPADGTKAFVREATSGTKPTTPDIPPAASGTPGVVVENELKIRNRLQQRQRQRQQQQQRRAANKPRKILRGGPLAARGTQDCRSHNVSGEDSQLVAREMLAPKPDPRLQHDPLQWAALRALPVSGADKANDGTNNNPNAGANNIFNGGASSNFNGGGIDKIRRASTMADFYSPDQNSYDDVDDEEIEALVNAMLRNTSGCNDGSFESDLRTFLNNVVPQSSNFDSGGSATHDVFKDYTPPLFPTKTNTNIFGGSAAPPSSPNGPASFFRNNNDDNNPQRQNSGSWFTRLFGATPTQVEAAYFQAQEWEAASPRWQSFTDDNDFVNTDDKYYPGKNGRRYLFDENNGFIGVDSDGDLEMMDLHRRHGGHGSDGNSGGGRRRHRHHHHHGTAVDSYRPRYHDRHLHRHHHHHGGTTATGNNSRPLGRRRRQRRGQSRVRFDLPAQNLEDDVAESSRQNELQYEDALESRQDGSTVSEDEQVRLDGFPFREITLYDGRLDAATNNASGDDDDDDYLPDVSREWSWCGVKGSRERRRIQHRDFWRAADELLGEALEGPSYEVELRSNPTAENGGKENLSTTRLRRDVTPEAFGEVVDDWLDNAQGNEVWMVPVPKEAQDTTTPASGGDEDIEAVKDILYRRSDKRPYSIFTGRPPHLPGRKRTKRTHSDCFGCETTPPYIPTFGQSMSPVYDANRGKLEAGFGGMNVQSMTPPPSPSPRTRLFKPIPGLDYCRECGIHFSSRTMYATHVDKHRQLRGRGGRSAGIYREKAFIPYHAAKKKKMAAEEPSSTSPSSFSSSSDKAWQSLTDMYKSADLGFRRGIGSTRRSASASPPTQQSPSLLSQHPQQHKELFPPHSGRRSSFNSFDETYAYGGGGGLFGPDHQRRWSRDRDIGLLSPGSPSSVKSPDSRNLFNRDARSRGSPNAQWSTAIELTPRSESWLADDERTPTTGGSGGDLRFSSEEALRQYQESRSIDLDKVFLHRRSKDNGSSCSRSSSCTTFSSLFSRFWRRYGRSAAQPSPSSHNNNNNNNNNNRPPPPHADDDNDDEDHAAAAAESAWSAPCDITDSTALALEQQTRHEIDVLRRSANEPPLHWGTVTAAHLDQQRREARYRNARTSDEIARTDAWLCERAQQVAARKRRHCAGAGADVRKGGREAARARCEWHERVARRLERHARDGRVVRVRVGVAGGDFCERQKWPDWELAWAAEVAKEGLGVPGEGEEVREWRLAQRRERLWKLWGGRVGGGGNSLPPPASGNENGNGPWDQRRQLVTRKPVPVSARGTLVPKPQPQPQPRPQSQRAEWVVVRKPVSGAELHRKKPRKEDGGTIRIRAVAATPGIPRIDYENIPLELRRAIAAERPVAEIEAQWLDTIRASPALSRFWRFHREALALNDQLRAESQEESARRPWTWVALNSEQREIVRDVLREHDVGIALAYSAAETMEDRESTPRRLMKEGRWEKPAADKGAGDADWERAAGKKAKKASKKRKPVEEDETPIPGKKARVEEEEHTKKKTKRSEREGRMMKKSIKQQKEKPKASSSTGIKKTTTIEVSSEPAAAETAGIKPWDKKGAAAGGKHGGESSDGEAEPAKKKQKTTAPTTSAIPAPSITKQAAKKTAKKTTKKKANKKTKKETKEVAIKETKNDATKRDATEKVLTKKEASKKKIKQTATEKTAAETSVTKKAATEKAAAEKDMEPNIKEHKGGYNLRNRK